MTEISAAQRPEDTIRWFGARIDQLEAENAAFKVAVTAKRLEMRPGDRIVCKVAGRLDAGEATEVHDRLRAILQLPDDIPLIVTDDTADVSEQADYRQLAAEILASYSKTGDGYRGRVGQVQVQRWHDRLGGA